MNEIAFDQPLVFLVAGVFTIAATLAGARIASGSRALLDDPNARSSHSRAISRAGGIAMLAGIIGGLFILAVFVGGPIRAPAFLFLVYLLLSSLVGIVDDRLSLAPIVKLAGQFFAALAFVWLIGPLESAPLPFIGETPLGAWGVAVTVFWIVAFVNVFNFMDGVNGIAGIAAATGLLIFAALALLLGAPAAAAFGVLVALAALSFLPDNLVRGRLFMGDGGSHLLAAAIAGLAVFAANESRFNMSALTAPMIFLPFILDVAFTLAHRALRGQPLLTAHREHVYQLMLRRGLSHGAVALRYGALIAFCGGAAVLMLTLSPVWQWTALVAFAALYLIFAVRVYQQAQGEGLIAPAPAKTPIRKAARSTS